MDRRRCELAGWIVALLVVSLVLYSSLQTDVRNPAVTQMSQMIRALQNQTAKLKSSIETPRFIQGPVIYQPSGETRNTPTLLIPDDEDLNKLEMLDLEHLWMRYVENIQQACGIQQHMGAEFDGGYHVCEKYLVKDKCLVYAFGSRRMFQFEDDVTKAYGCEIHSFDPFDGQRDHNHSKKCQFHSWGLGNKDQGKIFTLTSIKKKLHQENRILDILKIDIEGAEWDSLPEIISSGEMARVKLLIVEFHVCLGPCKDHKFRNKQHYLTRLAALRDIYNMGFRLYYFRQWTMCHLVDEKGSLKTGCHEVHFMKI